jgi:hypothetical protein
MVRGDRHPGSGLARFGPLDFDPQIPVEADRFHVVASLSRLEKPPMKTRIVRAIGPRRFERWQDDRGIC